MKNKLEVGKKYLVINEHFPIRHYHPLGSIVVCKEQFTTDGYLKGWFKIDGEDSSSTQYIYAEQLEPYELSLEDAEKAVAKAKKDLEASEKAVESALVDLETAKKESLEFTEGDIKNFMVVELDYDDEEEHWVRLVTIDGDRSTFRATGGRITNDCARKDLLKELNETYRKTTKPFTVTN